MQAEKEILEQELQKIKASTTIDDMGIKIEDAQELKVDEHFTKNVQAMINNVKRYVIKNYNE